MILSNIQGVSKNSEFSVFAIYIIRSKTMKSNFTKIERVVTFEGFIEHNRENPIVIIIVIIDSVVPPPMYALKNLYRYIIVAIITHSKHTLL